MAASVFCKGPNRNISGWWATRPLSPLLHPAVAAPKLPQTLHSPTHGCAQYNFMYETQRWACVACVAKGVERHRKSEGEAELLGTGSRIRAQQSLLWRDGGGGGRGTVQGRGSRRRGVARGPRCTTASCGSLPAWLQGWGDTAQSTRHGPTGRPRSAPSNSEDLMATTRQDGRQEHAWGHQALKLHLQRNCRALLGHPPPLLPGGSGCARRQQGKGLATTGLAPGPRPRGSSAPVPPAARRATVLTGPLSF